ncbi:MAG: Ycf66 family protein [Rhodospirillales bacterium]|nr:Ycf66 family protein [Rhodospirillales bacterium]
MFDPKNIVAAVIVILVCELGIWKRRFDPRRSGPEQVAKKYDALWSAIAIITGLIVALAADYNEFSTFGIIQLVVVTIFFIENFGLAQQFVASVLNARDSINRDS